MKKKSKCEYGGNITLPSTSLNEGGNIKKLPMGKSGIHINPANKGKFNATKKKTGKTTEELTHSSNPVTKKRAVFAQNEKKWHHGEDGLSIAKNDPNAPIPIPQDLQQAIDVDRAGQKPIDFNPFYGDDRANNGPAIPSFDIPNSKKGDVKDSILGGLALLDRMLPNQQIHPSVVQPQLMSGQHPYGTNSQATYADGGDIDPVTGKPRKVDSVPKGYVPYPKLGPNYYHNPQSTSSVQQSIGPKMSDEKWNAFLQTHPGWKPKTSVQNTDDIVYTQPESKPTNIQPIDPTYMSRGENMFNSGTKAVGESFYSLPQREGQNTPSTAHFAYYKPNSSEIDPTRQYQFPADVWSNQMTKGTNHLSVDPETFLAENIANAKYTGGGQVEPAPLSTPLNGYDTGGALSPEKAKQMLEDNSAHGKPLTKRQRQYFSEIASVNPISADSGASIKPLANNPYSASPTVQFNGPSHENGGIPIQHGNTPAEVEGGETGHMDDEGNLIIAGNMQYPGTNMKFKQVSKEIAKKEDKANKQKAKAEDVKNKVVDPTNRYDALTNTSAQLLDKGADMKLQQLAKDREHMTALQQAMLDTAKEHGIDAQEMSKGLLKRMAPIKGKGKYGATIHKYEQGGTIAKYWGGGSVDPEMSKFDMVDYLQSLAAKYNVNPTIMRNLVNQESGFSVAKPNKRGAAGIMQFIPSTAKQYGITPNQLTSTNPNDIKAVMDAGVRHFKSLLTNNNNDYKLALAAYNGGEGAINDVKKALGKDNITGDDMMKYWKTQNSLNPKGSPNLWRKQTYDYVNAITNGGDSRDFAKKYGYNTPDGSYVPFQATNIKTKNNSTVPSNDISPISNIPSVSPIDNSVNTTAKKDIPPQTEPFSVPRTFKIPTNREDLDMRQLYPELYAAATNRQEPVWAQQYNPELAQPYQVSFQDRLNNNTSTFNSLKSISGDNPEALATLAGQKYNADNSVSADEFRTNQGISNDVYNRNIQTLNDAQLRNLQIADQQYTRQSEAKSKTKAIDQSILSSVAAKYQQNKLENRQLMAQESTTGFRFDKDGSLVWMGSGDPFRYNDANPSNPPSSSKRDATYSYDANGNLVSKKEKISSEDDNSQKNGGSIVGTYNQMYGKRGR